jgi:hypothetical protein
MDKKMTFPMILMVALAVCFAAGCGGGGGEETAAADHEHAAGEDHGHDHDGGDHDHAEEGPDPRLAKVLAIADAADGTTDNVVAKCSGCSLAMEGSEEHTHQVGDYTLRFCSASCRDNFAEDSSKALIAMSETMAAE